ncbi:MAG: histidine kinase [Actinomycetota bacterium]|nr:histidine kinase [Actinomycetota bacterium]
MAAASLVAVAGLGLTNAWLAFGGLGAATLAAALLALSLIVTERRRHEVAEEELSEQATFLESLVESMATIAETLDADEILQRTCNEAEQLFGARATMLKPGELADGAPAEHVILAALRVHGKEVAALRLSRARPFARDDVVQATVLADFAARASENARLLAEAKVREAERAQLSDQLITAEQDERRRLALFLHDGPVQSMSGIGLMLDAVIDSVDDERLEDAKRVLASALERHRETIRSLRDLSFNIEPVVLRDQGFASAVRALADQIGLANQIQVDVDVDAAEALAEKVRVGLYQIIREAVNQALRRGPPTRISIRVEQTGEGEIATEIADDGAGERRRRTFESIEERARTLNGRITIGAGENGGTAVRIVLPSYAAESEG